MHDINAILPEVAGTLGEPTEGWSWRQIAGGDISQCYLLEFERLKVFLKCLAGQHGAVLQAEGVALKVIADSRSVRCPLVLAEGRSHGISWLALEHLELNPRSHAADQQLGRQLADLHHNTSKGFGWPQDNFIGLTHQKNPWRDHWGDFFVHQRLAPQIHWLRQSCPGWGAGADKALRQCAALMENHQPQAALLHGDLWAGNAAMLADQTPVVFDPASYYGDRETDLAMMALFGGYSTVCFDSYQEAWPLPDGYHHRRPIYQLYHVLNHANLFGGSYLQQAARLLDQVSRNK